MINFNKIIDISYSVCSIINRPSKKQIFYKLIDSRHIILDENNNVIANQNTGGIKLVYERYYQIPINLMILGKIINSFSKSEYLDTVIFWKPLKKYWPSNVKLPYTIIGKNSDPYLNCWLKIKNNFNNINEEITDIRIDEILENNDLSKSLSKELIIINKF